MFGADLTCYTTNDIRKNSPEHCVELFDQFIEKVTSHCTFAKIILSLPFLTIRDVELDEKILKCVVLLQYEILKYVVLLQYKILKCVVLLQYKMCCIITVLKCVVLLQY